MGFFQTSVETRELHKKETLRTRYYRNNFDQVVKALKVICDEEDIQMQHIDKRYGDVYMISQNFEVMVTIIQITPIETSVDFKLNYFSTFGYGRPEKKVVHLYERLDKMLTFKGTVLHVK